MANEKEVTVITRDKEGKEIREENVSTIEKGKLSTKVKYGDYQKLIQKKLEESVNVKNT